MTARHIVRAVATGGSGAPGGVSPEQLANKIDKGDLVINVRDYGAKGDGTADDTVALNAALAAARPGATVLFPAPVQGSHYKITDALTVPASITVEGGGRGCEIRQYTRTNKPVFDCLNVSGVTIHGFTLTLDGGPLTAMGAVFRAENGYTYCAGVWANGSGNTFHDLRVKDFATAVTLSAWDGGASMSATKRVGNTVRDLEVSGANFSVLFVCQDSLTISNLVTRDAVDSSSGANPLHALYCSGTSTLRSSNVTVSDCITRNVTFGSAYQFKYIDGLVASNLQADNCDGIVVGIDLTDALFTNLISRGDRAGTGGAFWLQKVTTQCSRVTIDGLVVHKAADNIGRCATIRCDDFRGSNMHLFTNLAARSDGYALEATGVRMTFDGVKIVGAGASRNRGMAVGGDANYPTSDVAISNIEMDNVIALIDFRNDGVSGTNIVSYDPGMQRNLETVNGISPFGQTGGVAPKFDLSRRPWMRTATVTAGGSPRPVPFLETVSRFVVSDATAFTVGAPDRASTAKAGMTHDVVIVNGTSGTLGAITWNGAYSLRAPFLAPPPGHAHAVTFMYDGTLWRELTRSTSAVEEKIVDVRAYGAKGDNATDDTVAIQAAIDAAGYGGQVLFPAGTYRYTSLALNHSQKLIGVGWHHLRDVTTWFGHANWSGSTWFGGSVLRCTATTGTSIVHTGSGGNNVMEGGIEDLLIIGPGSGTGVGLQIGSSSVPVVKPVYRNVKVCNFATGVTMANVNEASFYDLSIQGCTKAAGLTLGINANTFVGLNMQYCGDGLSFDDATSLGNTFVSPICQNITGTGMVIRGESAVITAPYFEICPVVMVFDQANHCSVHNPNVQGTGLKTMSVTASSQMNEFRGVKTAVGAFEITNAGYGSVFSGTLTGLTDTGGNTHLVDQNNAIHQAPKVITTATTGPSVQYGASALGARYGTAGPEDRQGTGSPEGAVTAPVSSTYRRSNGAVGTSLWAKESGTGNTGWAAVATHSPYGMERTFPIAFTATANEKADIYFTGNQWATFEVTLVGFFQSGNASGVLRATYSLAGSSTGTVHQNAMQYDSVQGPVADHFALLPIVWDAANSRWKLTVAHRAVTANSVSVRVRWQSPLPVYSNNIRDSIALSAIYTTDTTAAAAPVTAWAAGTAAVASAAGFGEINAADPKYGTPGTRAAFIAALDAAEALGKGTVVRIPAGLTIDVVSTLSMSGRSCQILGAGAGVTGTTGNVSVIRASAQTGPVLDFTGYVTPHSFKGKVTPLAQVMIVGSGVADPTKNNAGVRMRAMNSATFRDIAIMETGGPCLELAQSKGNAAYLSDFERIIMSTPVGAKANDVPYFYADECNGNRFRGFGFRSVVTSGDVGASGAAVIRANDTYVPHHNLFDAWWYEYLHPSTGAALFVFEGNTSTVRDFQFFDVTKEAGATGTAFIRFLTPPNHDNGGNIVTGLINGSDTSGGVIDTGVDLQQSRNRVEGIRGYRQKCVTIAADVDYSYVHLGGAESGLQTGTYNAFLINSTGKNNVLIDDSNGDEWRNGRWVRKLGVNLETVFNVADYGAKGDDATNDLVALNAAATAAGALPAGGVVQLNGKHVVSGALTLPSNVTLDGSRGSLRQTLALSPTVRVFNANNVRVRNVAITGLGTDYVNTSSVYGAAGVSISGTSTDTTVEGCTITGVAGAGVLAASSTVGRFAVRNCRIVGPGSPTITAVTGGFGGGVVVNGDVNDWSVTGCDISQYAQGVVSGNGSRLRVSDNHIHDIVGQHGVYVASVSKSVISDNVLDAITLQGIKVQIGTTGSPDAEDVTISGNTVTSGSHPILLTNTAGGTPRLRRFTVTGNTLRSVVNAGDGINGIYLVQSVLANNTIHNVRAGVALSNCAELTIAGNRVTSAAQQGVRIDTSTDITVRGNVLKDLGTANEASTEFGISTSGASTAGIVIDSNQVSDTTGSMRYGLYVVSGQQDTYVVRGNEFTGATDYGARLVAGSAIKEWSGNALGGTLGAVLNYPSAITREARALSIRDFGAVGNGVADDTAAIQAAIDAAMTSTAAATTTRVALRPLHIPKGTYKITAPLNVVSVQGFRMYGDGMESVLSVSGTLAQALRLQGVAYSEFAQFDIRGATAADTVTSALTLDWDGGTAAARSATTNHFRQIGIRNLKYVNGFAFGLSSGNFQVDQVTVEKCVAFGQWVAGDTTWWQHGFVSGSGNHANPLNHNYWGCVANQNRYNVYANVCNTTWVGGALGYGESDFRHAGTLELSASDFRTETSQRLLVQNGGASYLSSVILRNIRFVGNGIAADGRFVSMGYGGNLIMDNVFVTEHAATPTVYFTNASSRTLNIMARGLRTRQAIGSLFVSSGATAPLNVRVEGYTQTDSGSLPVQAVAQWARSYNVGADAIEVNVRDFGALGNNTGNDAPAIQAAIDSLPTTGPAGTTAGRVYLPRGAYRITTPIVLRPGVYLVGDGQKSTRIAAESGAGVLTWTSHLSGVVIEHLYLSGTGHIFAPSGGTADHGIDTVTVRNCRILQQGTTASIMHHVSGHDYDNVQFLECDLHRAPGGTVPAFNIINSGGAANENRWENCWAHSNGSSSAPFFKVESTSAGNYAYNNVFRQITGEQNVGGLIHLHNNFGSVIDSVTDYDASTYTDDLFKVGSSTGAPLLRSRYVTITNSGRRGGTLGAGVYDINLVGGQSSRCTVISPNHSSEPTSGLRINMAEADAHTLIGVPPQGSVWSTQPADVAHYFGSGAKFGTAVHVGNVSAEPATPSAGGVLFVQAGALKYKGSGGTVTTIGPA